MAFLPERTYFEEIIINGYDLSTGSNSFVSSDLSKYTLVSIQIIYNNIKGKNQFILEQGNDSTNWSNLTEEYELPLGTGNLIIDKGGFSAKHLKINFDITESGIITIKLLAKR